MRVVAALLLGFGATLCVLHDAKAASLSLMPNEENRSDFLQALELREDDFYNHEGWRCKKCPPGTYVSAHCTSLRPEGTCLPCQEDSYFPHMNPYNFCFNCKTCRLLDEVELKPCTKTSNTRCACKNGTFCSPSLPCETCHKCTSRCPEGEVMVRPCTPESDIQCEKSTVVTPTASPTPAAGSKVHRVGIVLGVLSIFALLISGVFVLCLFREYRKRGRARVTESTAAMCSSRTIQWLKRKFNLQQSEERDNNLNEQVDQESRFLSQSPDDVSIMEPLQAPEKESSVTERHLVPQNGRDPMEALRQSFQIFIDLVPFNKWKRFMRALDLTDNEIHIAEVDEKCVNDQYFQMLRTWLTKKGKEATLDTLLDTLCAIELRGVVKNIIDELIAKGLYCYEG